MALALISSFGNRCRVNPCTRKVLGEDVNASSSATRAQREDRARAKEQEDRDNHPQGARRDRTNIVHYLVVDIRWRNLERFRSYGHQLGRWVIIAT